MVETELKSLFLSDERRAELLKKIRTPRKWSLFSTETCNSSFFGELEPLGGNSVVLTISAEAAVEVLWHSEKWNSCHRRRRPSSGMAAFCTNQILAKTERLESLGSQDTPKTEHQQIFKKETRNSRKSPLGMVIPSGRHCGFCRVVHFSRASFRGAILLRQASLAQGELEKVGLFASVEIPTL